MALWRRRRRQFARPKRRRSSIRRRRWRHAQRRDRIRQVGGRAAGDRFVWNSTTETSLTPATMDLITDFNFAEGDRIDVMAVDADVFAPGNQMFRFIGTAAFTLNAATPDPSDVIPARSSTTTPAAIPTSSCKPARLLTSRAASSSPGYTPRRPAGSICDRRHPGCRRSSSAAPRALRGLTLEQAAMRSMNVRKTFHLQGTTARLRQLYTPTGGYHCVGDAACHVCASFGSRRKFAFAWRSNVPMN